MDIALLQAAVYITVEILPLPGAQGISEAVYHTAFSGIFTGDISSAEEQYLVEHKKVGSVTFYKAAHHGSRYSNSRDFLMALSPEITTISCGENNRYGHPGEEALCNIKESGSAVYETMECGRIRIRMENGKPVVEKFLEGR